MVSAYVGLLCGLRFVGIVKLRDSLLEFRGGTSAEAHNWTRSTSTNIFDILRTIKIPNRLQRYPLYKVSCSCSLIAEFCNSVQKARQRIRLALPIRLVSTRSDSSTRVLLCASIRVSSLTRLYNMVAVNQFYKIRKIRFSMIVGGEFVMRDGWLHRCRCRTLTWKRMLLSLH